MHEREIDTRLIALKTPKGGTIRTVPNNAENRSYLEAERTQWQSLAAVLGRPDFSSLRIVGVHR